MCYFAASFQNEPLYYRDLNIRNCCLQTLKLDLQQDPVLHKQRSNTNQLKSSYVCLIIGEFQYI